MFSFLLFSLLFGISFIHVGEFDNLSFVIHYCY